MVNMGSSQTRFGAHSVSPAIAAALFPMRLTLVSSLLGALVDLLLQ